MTAGCRAGLNSLLKEWDFDVQPLKGRLILRDLRYR
jgi:hypothetical protein